MNKNGANLIASVSIIITMAVAQFPLPVHATGEVVAWGDNGLNQASMPGGLSNVVAIAAGDFHSLALTAEGQVVAWGFNEAGQATVPSALSNVVAIAAGGEHSLTLTAEGRVAAWGRYYNGFTPDGQTIYVPMTVPDELSNVVAIAAGFYHSLALTAEGRVLAWGGNLNGQTNVPNGLSNVVAIAAGESHSLALTDEGRIVAWGQYYTDSRYAPMTVPNGLSNVVGIAAGRWHNLALTAEGKVVGWGFNEAGQATVPGGLSNVVAIAAGGAHSLALTADGQVVQWPEQSQAVRGLSNVVAIAAGDWQSLALCGLPPGVAAPARVGPQLLLATADRPFHHRIRVRNGATAYGATGLPPGLTLDSKTGLITGLPMQTGKYSIVFSANNNVGATAWEVTLFVNEPSAPSVVTEGLVPASLGVGFNIVVAAYNAPEWYGASGLPAGLALDAQTGLISGVPVEAGEFEVSLVASNRYGLGAGWLTIRVSPVVAWGDNEDGQMRMPSGLSNVVAIAAGGEQNIVFSQNHSLALSSEGRVLAWRGDRSVFPDYGQEVVPSGLSNVVAIAAGGVHSLALTADGQVVAWPSNVVGQMTVTRGLSNVVAIAAGGVHNLALTSEGRVYAWGNYDEIGIAAPDTLSNVVAIAAGLDISGRICLALTSEGRVVGWGSYYDFSANTRVPVTVPSGVSNVVAIAAGGCHCLALTAGGRVVAWGNNFFGQTDVSGGLSNVVAIAAGYVHSLALTSEGRVVAWGSNDRGQADVPIGLSNVVAIAAGYYHSVALVQQPTVPTPGLELSRGTSGLALQAQGVPGISCQLLRASRLPGPWFPSKHVTFTNHMQWLRSPDASQSAQFYRLLRK